MGVFRQLGLLIWKHLLRRKRQPGILALEYLWPIILFVTLLALRQAWPPKQTPTCHRNPRALPSAGGVTFLQNFMCNLDNKCIENDTSTLYLDNTGFSQLASAFAPLVSSTDSLEALENLPSAIETLNSLEQTIADPQVQELLELDMTVGSLLRDPEVLERHLVEVLGVMAQEEAVALMNATINVNMVFDLLGNTGALDVICDPTALQRYLTFPAGVNVTAVSRSLCQINASHIEDLTNTFVSQIDVQNLLDVASRLSGLFGSYTLSSGLRDVASLLNITMDTSLIVGSMEPIAEAIDWLLRAADLLQDVDVNTLDTFTIMTEIYDRLSPLMNGMNDSVTIQQAITLPMEYINAIVTWAQGGPLTLPASTTSLVALLPLPDEVLIMMAPLLNISSADLTQIFNMEIDSNAALEMLAMLENSTDPQWILCGNGTDLRDIFIPQSSENEALVEMAVMNLCSVNVTELIHSVTANNTTLAVLMQGFEIQRAAQNIDWEWLLSANATMAARLDEIGSILEPFLAPLEGTSIQGLWQAVSTGVSFVYTIATNSSQSALTSMLDNIQMALGTIPDASAATQYIAVTGSVATYGQALQNRTLAFLGYMEEMVLNDATMQQAITVILEQGPSASGQLIMYLTQPSTVEMFLTDPNQVASVMCNVTWIESMLNLDPSDTERVSTVSQAFCEQMPRIIQDVQSLLQLDDLQQQAEFLIHVLRGRQQPLNYTLSDVTNTITALMSADVPGTVYNFTMKLQAQYPMMQFTEQDMEQLMGTAATMSTYSSISMAVISAGEALQNSPMWPAIGPTVEALYRFEASVNTLLRSYQNFTAPGTDVGVLYSYIIAYGPEVVEGCMQYLIERVQADTMPVTVDGVERMLCIELTADDMPSDIPFTEMQSLMCSPTLEQFIVQVQEIIVDVNTSLHAEFSWGSAVTEGKQFYESWILPIMAGGDIPIVSDIVGMVNLTAWMYTMMAATIMMSPEMIVSSLTLVDEVMADNKDWNEKKYMLQIYLNMTQMNMALMEDYKDGILLSDLMTNGSMMYELLEQAMHAVPDAIEMVTQVIVHPDQMIQTMMTTDMSNLSLCGDVRMSEWMSFNDLAAMDALEEMICDVDLNVMLTEMMTMTPYGDQYNTMMEQMNMAANVTERVTVDWAQVVNMVTSMQHTMNESQTDMLEQMMWFPDVVDQDSIQAIEDSMQDMMTTLDSLGMDNYTEMMSNMGLMVMNMTSSMGEQQEIQSFQENMNAGTAYIMEFINRHLTAMSGSTFSVVNYINSNELDRILTSMATSPELIEVMAHSAATLMADPIKVSVLLTSPYLMTFCQNVSMVTSLITIPPSSTITVSEVQTALCGMAFNATAFVSEIMVSIDGLDTLVRQISDLLMGDVAPYNMQQINAMTEAAIAQISVNPPTISLGIDDSFLQPEVWYNVWIDIDENTVLPLIAPDELINIVANTTSLLTSILGTVSQALNLNHILAIETEIMAILIEGLEPYSGRNLTVAVLLEGRPETQRLYDQLENVPAFMAVMVHTLMAQSDQLAPVFAGNPMAMCDSSVQYSFPPQATLVDGFWSMLDTLCSTDYTAVEIELSGFIDVQAISDVITQPWNGTANVTEFAENSERLGGLLGELGSWLPPVAMEMINQVNTDVWLQALGSLAEESLYMDGMLQNLNSLRELMAAHDMDDSLFFYVADVMAETIKYISVQALDPITMLTNGSETQQILYVMNQLPEILQTVLSESIGPDREAFYEWLIASFQQCDGDTSGTGDLLYDVINILCRMNPENLITQYVPQSTLTMYSTLMNGQSVPATDTATFLTNVMQLQTDLAVLIQSPAHVMLNMSEVITTFPWLNAGNYGSLLAFLEQSFMLPVEMNQTDVERYITNLISLSGLPSSLPVAGMKPYLNGLQAVIQMANSKLDLLLSGGVITLPDLFPDATHLQELFVVLDDMPDLVSILQISLNTPQFNSLFGMNMTTVYTTFCIDMVPFSQYLTLPSGSTYDLNNLQQQICELEFDGIGAEMETYFDTIHIAYQFQNNTAVNMTALQQDITEFYARLNALSTTPIVLQTGWTWHNNSLWLENLARWGTLFDDTGVVFNNTISQMNALLELIGNGPETELMRMLMESFLDEFEDVMNLATQGITSPLVQFSWPDFAEAMRNLVVPVVNITSNSSTLDASMIDALMVQLHNITDIEDLMEQSGMILNLMSGMFGDSAHIMNGYVRALTFVMEYAMNLTMEDQYMHISTLLGNYSYILDVTMRAMDFDPALISDLMQVSLRLDKLGDLISLSPDVLSTLACNITQLDMYFVYPQTFDVDQLQTAFCNFNASDFTSTVVNAMGIYDLVSNVLGGMDSPSFNSTEFTALTTQFIDQLLNYSSMVENNFEVLAAMNFGEDIALWQQLQAIYQLSNTDMLIHFSEMASSTGLLAMIEDTPYAYEMLAALHDVNLYLAIINDYAQGMTGPITMGDLVQNGSMTYTYLETAFSNIPGAIQAVMSSPVDLMQILQVQSWGDFLSLWCEGDVAEALAQTVCALNSTDLFHDMSLQINHTLLLDQLVLITMVDPSADLNFTEIATNLLALPDTVDLLLNVQLPELPQFFMYDGNWTAWHMSLAQAFANTSITDGSTLTLLGNWLNELTMSFENETWYQDILPMLHTVNLVVDGSQENILQMANNISLASIMANQDTLWNYINGHINMAPETIVTFLQTPINMSHISYLVMVGGTPNLFCDGNLLLSPTSADQTILQFLCNSSYEQMGMEATGILNLNSMISQVSDVYLNQSMGINQPLNWTDYLLNVKSLATAFDSSLMQPVALEQFFPYPTNLTHWTQQFYDLYNGLTNQGTGTIQLLGSWLNGLSMAFENETWYQDMIPMLHSVSLVVEGLQDNMLQMANNISLASIMADQETLWNYINGHISMAPDTLRSFILSPVNVSHISYLVTVGGTSNIFCDGNLLLSPTTTDLTILAFLCDSDYEQMGMEAAGILNLESMISQVSAIYLNQSMSIGQPFNWTGYLQNVETLIAAFGSGLTQPISPEHFLPYPTNMTQWIQQFSSLYMNLTNQATMTIQFMISQMSDLLGVMSTGPETEIVRALMDSFLNSFETVLDLSSQPDQTVTHALTFGDLLATVPVVGQILSDQVGSSSALMNATIVDMVAFMNFALSEEPFQYLCTMYNQSGMYYPEGTDMIAFQSDICAISNQTSMSGQVLRDAGWLPMWVATEMTSPQFNWTAFVDAMQDLVVPIVNITSNSSTFNASMVDALMVQLYNITDIEDLMEQSGMLLNLMTSMFGDSAQVITEYIAAMEVVMEYAVSLTAGDRYIHVSTLLGNYSYVLDVALLAMDFDPALIDDLMQVSVRLDKLGELISLSPGDMSTLACNITQLDMYFMYPQTLAVDQLQAAFCNFNASDFTSTMLNALGISDLVNNVLSNMASPSINSTEFSVLTAQFIDQLLNYSSVVENNFETLAAMYFGEDIALWQQLQAIYQLPDRDILIHFSEMASSTGLLAMIEDTPYAYEMLAALHDVNLYLTIINDYAQGMTGPITMGDLIQNGSMTYTYLSTAFANVPGAINAVMTSPVDLMQILQVQSWGGFLSLWCEGDVNGALAQTVCALNSSDLINDMSLQINHTMLLDELMLITMVDPGANLNFTEIATNLMALPDTVDLLLNMQLPELPQFFMFDGNWTAWYLSLAQAFTNTSITDGTTMTLLGNWINELTMPFENETWYQDILPMLHTANLVVDGTQEHILQMANNISLASIMADQETLLNYINTNIDMAPDAIRIFFLSPVNISHISYLVTVGGTSNIFCDVNLLLSPTPADQAILQYLCDSNYEQMGMEATGILSLESMISQVSDVYLSQSMNISQPFNWTEYLQNVESLTAAFGSVLTQPVSLEQFLPYPTNLTHWTQQFVDLYMEVSDEGTGTTQLLSQTLQRMMDVVEEMTGNSTSGVAQAIITVLSTISEKLQVIADDGTVTLGSLVGNATGLDDVLQSLFGLREDEVIFLLNSTLPMQTIQTLVNGEELTLAFCNTTNDLENRALNVQAVICELNMTALTTTITDHFNYSAILDAIAAMSSPVVTSSNWTQVGSETERLVELVYQLVQTDLQLEPNLQQIDQLATIIPGVAQAMVNMFMNDSLTDMLMTVATNLTSLVPGMDQAAQMLGQFLTVLQGEVDIVRNTSEIWTALLGNSSGLMDLVTTLSTSYMNISSQLTKQLLYNMSLTNIETFVTEHSSQLLCDQAIMQQALLASYPDGIPDYINITAVEDIVCNFNMTQWLSNLTVAGVDVDVLWTFLNQIYMDLYITNTTELTTAPSTWAANITSNIQGLLQDLGLLDSQSPELQDMLDYSSIEMMITQMINLMNAGDTTGVFAMMDELQSTFSDNILWQRFHIYADFGAELLDIINNRLAAGTAVLNIWDLLIDPQTADQWFSSVISEEASISLANAGINMTQIPVLMNATIFPDMVCNWTTFSNLFSFPDTVDKAAMFTDICVMAQDSTALVTEFLGLFNETLLTQIWNMLYQNSSTTLSPWAQLGSQVDTLMSNIANLQNRVDNESHGFSEWVNQMALFVDAAMDRTVTDAAQVMCSLGAYISSAMRVDGDGFPLNSEILWYEYSGLRLAVLSVPLLQDVEELVCNLEVSTISQVLAILNSTSYSSFEQQLTTLLQGPPAQSTCEDFLAMANITFQEVYPSLDLESSVMNVLKCISENVGTEVPMFDEMDMLITTLREMQELLATIPSLPGLPLDQVQIYLDLFVGTLQSNEPISDVNEIIDLLLNSTDILTMLVNTVGLSTEEAEAVLYAIAEVDILDYNATAQQVFNVLCTLGNTSTALPSELCDPTVEMTMTVLNKALGSDQFNIAQENSAGIDFPWAVSFMEHVASVIDDVTVFSELSNMMGDLDLAQVVDLLPQLQAAFANGSVVDVIRNDVQTLLNDLQVILPDEIMQTVTADVMTFTDGLLGLHVVLQYLPQTVYFNEILRSPSDLRNYSINQLGISVESTDAILQSGFSMSLLLELYIADPLSSILCNRSMWDMILEGPGNVTVALEQLCAMETGVAANFTNALLSQLDLGQYMETWIGLNSASLLSGLNISMDDLETMASQFQPLSEAMTVIFADIDDSPSLMDLTSILNADLSDPESVTDHLKDLGKFMCGDPETFVVSDPNNLLSVGGSTTLSATQQAEMEELDTQFCQDMYRQIQQIGDAGRILWTFVKPLIMGQVIYTPDTPETRAIIEEARWIIRGLDSVEEMSRMLLDSMDQISSNTTFNYDILQETLANPVVSSALTDMLGFNALDLASQLQSLGSITPEQMDQMTSLARLLYNLTQCVETDFIAVESEDEMLRRAAELRDNDRLLAGVVFLDQRSRKRRQSETSSIPPYIQYKIRMDIELVHAHTSKLTGGVWLPKAESEFFSQLTYFHGFLPLQDLLDQAIIKLQTGVDDQPPVTMQEFPFPCHEWDSYQYHMGAYYFPVIMALAWLVAVGNSIAAMVQDRETGIEHTLRLLGLRSSLSWFAWFINTFGSMCLLSLIVVLLIKVGSLMRFIDTLVLLVYLLLFSFSTTMLCYMISAFFTRATLAALVGIIVYLITYLPIIIIVAVGQDMLFWQNILMSLASTSAFTYGCKFMMLQELLGVGLQWDNVNANITEDFTFAWVLYMMLIDAAIYFIIGWYFRQIIPGKYMQPEVWYFPVSPSYWGCSHKKWKKTRPTKFASDGINGGTGEKTYDRKDSIDNLDLPVGVSMHHLTKCYKKGPAALNDLTVDLHEGIVTALLGHNGAGKSTAIQMLCGVYKPTSGMAYIGQYNTDTQFSKIHKVLGFCPQHDVLIEHMTVHEHLQFFAGMRGLTGSSAKIQIQSMLDSIRLREMIHQKVSKLSGGQRRRLSVGLAFLGGSKVVILDEPTSGIDPSARHLIWEIIAEHRLGRTIILSTHHMDEAETVGDRILMLHKGRLLCHGSPMALKTENGTGYQVIITKTTKGQEMASETDEAILSFFQQHIANAHQKKSVGTDAVIVLPCNQPMVLHTLLKDLNSQKETLMIQNFSLTATDMEEVFMSLSKEAEVDSMESNGTSIDIEEHGNSARVDEEGRTSACKKSSGATLKFSQFGALLHKRFLHNVKDIRGYITQLLLPILFLLLALLCTLFKQDVSSQPSLMLTPALYREENAMFIRNDVASPLFENMVESLFRDPGVSTTCMPDSPMNDVCTMDPTALWRPDISQSEMEELVNPPNCSCETGFLQCPDAAAGLPPARMTTATTNQIFLLDDNQFSTGDYLIRTQMDYIYKRFGGWTLDSANEMKVWFNNKGYHAAPAFYNAMSNMKLRAMLKQTNSSWNDIEQYGITTYSHPFPRSADDLVNIEIIENIADVGIATTILVAFCFVPASLAIYLIQERASNEKRLQHIYGVGTFLYWITAFIWDLFIYALVAAIATGITYAFHIDVFTVSENLAAFFTLIMLFGWSCIPLSYLISRCFKDPTIGFVAIFLIHLTIALNTAACTLILDLFDYMNPTIGLVNTIVSYVFLVFPQFCLGQGLVTITYNHLVMVVFAQFDIDKYTSPFSFEGCAWPMVAMAIEGIIFFLFTLILDAQGRCCVRKPKVNTQLADPNEDTDVSLERQRVIAGESRDDLLTIFNLGKQYKRGLHKIQAVDNVCVGIRKGECFGLLGVNGAGKTTTFKMLTGDVAPSDGAIFLNNKNITADPTKINQNIGYCPQFDAIDNLLTGLQTLEFYAKLKGIAPKDINMVCQSTAKKFGLTQLLHKRVKQYSGGNKRKLSAAVALIGDPELVLMDEPTTGMDPMARRLVWENIKETIQQDRSVILTSHSMAECDTVCTRLGILVNGKFLCMGSGQHLKKRFGGGYILRMRVSSTSSPDLVTRKITEAFPHSHLVHRHLQNMSVEIRLSEHDLAEPFLWIAENMESLGIRDYSLTQTTMDQVFWYFARFQYDGKVAHQQFRPATNKKASVFPHVGTRIKPVGEDLSDIDSSRISGGQGVPQKRNDVDDTSVNQIL